MRIIAGRFRGHSIQSPPGHMTRPSTARTRESLFALVDSRIYLEDAEVLDLFSGTGALGLEAISRGASLVTFVEKDAEVLDFARQNAETLGVSDQCIFIKGDALTYLRRYNGPELDLIMADPPYELDGLRDIPDLAIPHLHTDGVLTLEHSSHDWFDEHPHQMTSRKYGRTIVTIFRPPLPPKDEEEGDAEPTSEGAADAATEPKTDARSEAEQDDLVADVLGRSLPDNASSDSNSVDNDAPDAESEAPRNNK